jgi:hypothetical protein
MAPSVHPLEEVGETEEHGTLNTEIEQVNRCTIGIWNQKFVENMLNF